MGLIRAALDEIRSSVSIPVYPRDPALARLLGIGQNSSAGVYVDAESAQSLSAVWAACRLLSRSIASLPLVVYETRKSGGKDRATAHPLFNLLHSQPNDLQTSYEWREMQQGHSLVRGNCYAQIVFTRGSRVSEIVPISPDAVRPRKVEDRIVYDVSQKNGGSVSLEARDVLHIKGPSTDGIVGVDPISYARRSLGMGIAAEEYGAALFRNSAMPAGILKTDASLTDPARSRLEADLQQNHGSLLNAHKTAILEEGLSWQAIGFSPENTQFIESRKFTTTQVAQWFNVPPHMIGDLERATFSNIEQQAIDYVVHSLRPWLTAWEQRLEMSLLSPSERGRFQIRFVVEGLLRGDSAARSAFYRELFGIGAISQNEIRELEDRNPVEGGDLRYVPLNMIPSHLAEDFYAGGRGGGGDVVPDDGGNDPMPDDEAEVTPDAAEGDAGVGDAVAPELVLNGAQVQSLVQIVQLVHAGGLFWDSALEIIQSAFGMSKDKAINVLGPKALAGTLKPEEVDASVRLRVKSPDAERRAAQVKARSEVAARYRPMFEGVLQKVTEREGREVTELAEKNMTERNSLSVIAALDAYFADNSEYRTWVRAAMTPAFYALAAAVEPLAAKEVNAATLSKDDLAKWVGELAKSFAARHAASSRGQLTAIIRDNPDVVLEALSTKLEEWVVSRSVRIAARETVKASRATTRNVYERAGHQRIQWVTRGESCPYCEGLSGRIVGIRDAFVGKGDILIAADRPPLRIRQKIGHPPVHAGCDCDILPA